MKLIIVILVFVATLSCAPLEMVEAAPQSVSTTSSGTPEASSTEHVLVPNGTSLRVQLVNGDSSVTAKVRDLIQFTVVDSVWVNRFPIIRQGMTLSGRVAFVTQAHRGGRNGQVGIAVDRFKLTTGESATIRTTLKPRTTGDKAKTDLKVAGETVAIFSMVGPLGLAAPFFKGDEKSVAEGAIETVFLNGPLTISRTATTELVSPTDAGLTHIFYLDRHIGSHRTLFCGQKSLGSSYSINTVHRFDMKPGAYWFSTGDSDDLPIKIDALEVGQYLIEREHGGLSLKNFKRNQESIYARKENLIAHNLSKLPEDGLQLLSAEPHR